MTVLARLIIGAILTCDVRSIDQTEPGQSGVVAALLYLFCVVAPGVGLALGSAAPWLANDLKAAVTAQPHDHSAHQHGDTHADHQSHARGSQQHKHDGTASAGPCCAMLCLSTMAADLPLIAKLGQPKSVRIAENYQRLPDKAPPRHYRPPIA